MKNKCIIASFGGSGSTYLANKLKSTKAFEVFHSHALPNDNIRLGIPVFNSITGKQEGPFSNELFVPTETKVILILRTPSHAYESRACFNHFCHIWSNSDYFDEIVNHVDDSARFKEEFQKSWRKYVDADRDILNLKEYMIAWQSFMENSVENVFFVKYEELGAFSHQLSEFLELPEALDFSDFSAKPREVKEKTKTIFEETDKIFQEMIPRAFCNAQHSEPRISNEVEIIEGLTFKLSGLTAGAGDSIDRVRKVFNLIKSIKGAKIRIPEYSNYHCKDFDFFEFFNVNSLSDDFEEKPQVKLGIASFISHLLLEPSSLSSKVTYELDLFNQQDFKRIDYYQKFFKVEPYFDRLLAQNFSPEMSNPFKRDDVYKVTVHLRRSDIIGRVLDGKVEQGPIGAMGLHARYLLTLEDIPDVLESLKIPEGMDIDVIIVSDGIRNKKQLLNKYPQSVQAIHALETELVQGEINCDKVTISERIIGNSEHATFETLRAMYFSDVVISASSVFPNLICKLAGVSLVKVKK